MQLYVIRQVSLRIFGKTADLRVNWSFGVVG